ncbi:MAG: 30S ribosomal protein S8e [Thermoprotei archaeon]
MSVYQGNDFRKVSGGRKRPHRMNRKYELGRFPTMTVASEREEIETLRVRGGNLKIRCKRVLYANVVDPSTNTIKKVKITKVVETPANRELARLSVITKGTIIETEIGLARVTSRPGQDGVVNAVLIKE